MNTPITPEFGDDDVARGLAALEQHLADIAVVSDLAPRTSVASDDAEDDDVVEDGEDTLVPGETARVRKLRTQVAEDAQLRDLYAQQLAVDLDSPRVLARRRKGQEAAKLHALSQHPAVRALQARRVLRVITIAGLTALVLALGWSTAYVHKFAADGAPAWSAGWVVGWFVEPFISLALLTIVAAKAFFATRGHLVTSPTLRKIERLFLGLSLGMNIYPTLPWIGPADEFHLPDTVLHALGPIVAVAVVTAMPVLWAEFASLDHGLTGSPNRPTGRRYPPTGNPLTSASYSENAEYRTREVTDYVQGLTDQVRRLIDRGALTRNPSASAIRRALGCGMDQARRVRDALADRHV